MHRRWSLAAPLALALCTASAAPPADVKNAVTTTRPPVASDPAVDPHAPASAKLPAAAFQPKRVAEEDEEGEQSWESAKWTQATLRVRGSGTHRFAVTKPASVMIKAEWSSTAEITIDVRRAGASLAHATPKKGPDGSMSAVATVHVTQPGELTIDATSGASQTIPIKLYVGVMPTTH
jgi:hypothetical protein